MSNNQINDGKRIVLPSESDVRSAEDIWRPIVYYYLTCGSSGRLQNKQPSPTFPTEWIHMRRHYQLVAFCLILCGSLLLLAADTGAPTFTNRKAAGEQLLIQGEYEGQVGDNDWGAHVIATGKDSFRAIGYMGGLPGKGWSGDAGQYLSGKLKDGVVTMRTDDFSIKVDGKQLTVFNPNHDELGSLKKVVRKSETLGKKPPQNAIILFDGKSTDQWINGKLVNNKFLGATNCYTKEKFGDHQLHIEFRTPFMPESSGQARGNSGVYVQGRYEIQVLDSFGLEGKDNECGGIYQVSKPKVNMCFPPLTWQTYDIDFTAAKWEGDKKVRNARITVKHNGVIIHNDLELPRHTPGRKQEAPGPEALFLQDHGNPVVYRNIWAVKN